MWRLEIIFYIHPLISKLHNLIFLYVCAGILFKVVNKLAGYSFFLFPKKKPTYNYHLSGYNIKIEAIIMTWKKIQEKTIRMEAKMPEIMKYVARPCLVVWFEFQGFTDPYYSMDIFILDS